MTPDVFMLSSALLVGVFGSTHCALMCGGIAVSLSRQPADFVGSIALHGGRVLGYSFAGLCAASLVHTLVGFAPWPVLGTTLRATAGLLLLLAALKISGLSQKLTLKRVARWAAGPAHRWWQFLAPARAKLSGARTHSRSTQLLRTLGIGALWGWMPCGLSFTMLTAAMLRVDAIEGALLMLAFGIGTTPVMLTISRTGSSLMRKGGSAIAALLIAFAGVVTLSLPWLSARPELHGLLKGLGCLG